MKRAAQLRNSALLLSALALSGCMGETGFGTVTAISLTETGHQPQLIASEAELQQAGSRTATLLKKPLDAQSAVEISFLNNRALQASFNELGIAQAALIRGSLPANPRFGVSRLSGSGELEIEREVLVGLFSILTTPSRAARAQEEFSAAQMRAAETTLRLAIDVRRQYYRAVAANEQVAVLSEAKALTDTQADIAKKLGETGGLNKLDRVC